MTNTLGVCLFSLLLFCTDLSSARQAPKECAKGPKYWCQSLSQAADCGAVGHCVGTLWEKQSEVTTSNEVSDKLLRTFRQLKDVKDLINADYLATRVSSTCKDLPAPAQRICRQNTAHLEEYLLHVLNSDTTPETMCKIVGICNNEKLDNILASKKKKADVPEKSKPALLGSAHCTWGPSYWCSNFSTGRECKATHHCVERVWSKMTVSEDKDDICKICTDMVKQARDQLQSNETQEELKEVFEGSCKLIPIKLVAKECMRLADDFVPELVETLASQMNPQQVCSVAGLCNNAKIDKLLEEYNTQLKLREGCNQCHQTVGVIRKRFDVSTDDDFLVGLLRMCGKMDSLSDSCSMLVFKYYENIVEAAKKDLTPQGVCHLSGQCAFKYHTHDEFVFPIVKFEELSAEDHLSGQRTYKFHTHVVSVYLTVKFKELSAEDDVPCEFCEKLVSHLRDTLIANTTELEFERVLKGLCKQTGNFKTECLQLVDQYYATIYNFLVSDMKPAVICSMIGICGKPAETPVAPLLPRDLAVKVIGPTSKLIGAEEAKIAHIPVTTKQANVRIMSDPAPLPIERMFINLNNEPTTGKPCAFCQYLLHYLQVELSDSNNEERIKEAIEKSCDHLPQSVESECKQFVTEYEPAVVALLVQQIDPASVCPALGLCPKTTEVRRVAINSDKSNCPLCLFAVEQLETILKNNRSETSIRHALDGLCNHLSQKLRTECVDFVDTYTNQLVEMLVANFNAQEICVFLKLCADNSAKTDPMALSSSIDKYFEKPHLRGDRNNMKKPMLPKHMLDKEAGGDIETNEIPDNTVNGRPIKTVSQKTACVICEFVLKEIDDEIRDKHNEDEIKKVVHGICHRMPKSVRNECDQFVEKYADLVISLLAQDLEPSAVCAELKLCDPNDLIEVKQEILDCAVCETVVMAVKKVMSNDKVDRNIVHIVEKSCGLLPAKYSQRCHTMMEIYGDSVIHLIEELGTKGVCQKIGLCAAPGAFVHMTRAKRH